VLTELKILGGCWITSVMGVAAQPVLGVLGSDEALKKLSSGPAQMVLAVVVLGLTGAIIWLVKRLLKSYEDRVTEAKQRTDDVHKQHMEMQKTMEANSVALASNAMASEQLKEAVYHLAKCVDKCPGPRSDEIIARGKLPLQG
jgi:cytoskeletal protein RodZ